MYLQHLHTTHVNTSHCTNTLELFRTRGEQAKEYENEERKLICLEWKPHRFTFIYYQTSNVWHIYLNVYPHIVDETKSKTEMPNASNTTTKTWRLFRPVICTRTFSVFGFIYTLQKKFCSLFERNVQQPKYKQHWSKTIRIVVRQQNS